MKSILLFFVSVLALNAGYTNLTYPAINLAFIQHTLLMDTTFDTPQRNRAITSPAIHSLAHWTITVAELLCGLLCLAGSILHLAKSSYAKVVSMAGLMIGIGVWFFGFRAIAGEWFGMWQSKEWNGLPDGERIALALLVILGIVSRR